MMSEAEYLKTLSMEFFPRIAAGEVERRFYRSHGLDAETTEEWVRGGHKYLYMAAPLPHVYRRLVADSDLVIGSRSFRVRTVAGHSPEEIMLLSDTRDVYFCADQLAPKIAPNIAVQSNDPLGDPLSYYLRSLDEIALDRPDPALMLPGHEQPFFGFSSRVEELKAYYARRAGIVEAACADGPKTASELVSYLFRKPPGPVWIGFVISEAVTYANHLVNQGRLSRREEGGVIRFACP
ncbi:MAG: hypothetical protein M9939_23650 [Mesorhizobium sp.]|nr:hypothetical protein [Mesorhizobium sp.]MCO5164099.1 hypothetical protein [Mesorhizobium sp.]